MEKGDIKLIKIDGKINPADFLTKPESAKEIVCLSKILGYVMPTRKYIHRDEEAGILEVVKWMNEINRERTKPQRERRHPCE